MGLPPYQRAAMRAFSARIFHDPQPALQAVQQPLLGVFGSDDTSNPTDASAAVLRELRGAGKQIDICIIPNTGHAMTRWTAPQAGFYAPGFLDLVAEWSVARARARHPAAVWNPAPCQ